VPPLSLRHEIALWPVGCYATGLDAGWTPYQDRSTPRLDESCLSSVDPRPHIPPAPQPAPERVISNRLARRKPRNTIIPTETTIICGVEIITKWTTVPIEED